MKRLGLLSLLLAVASLAAAQGLDAVYLEGKVETVNGSTWRVLSTGDAVPADASIRLAPDSLLQLKGPEVEIVLTRAGTYSVQALLRARRTLGAPGVGVVFEGAMRLAGFGKVRRHGTSTTMGGRAPDESESDDDDWAETNAQVFLNAGRLYIKAGKYEKAIEQLNEALASATGEEAPEIHYYLGYASALGGDLKQAWKQTAGLTPSANDAWYGDFILFKARLLEETSAYADALALLAHEGGGLAQDSKRAPLYYLLLGVAYRGAGNGAQAQRALSKVTTLAGDSDLGRAAATLLEQQ
jgi:tetratricopeptide (TPR) repeat protein